jgi:hypothetical protein
MEYVALTITALGAIGLLIIGGFLAMRHHTAASSAVLGFAFLFVLLLFVSKFKHVHGFGFEAEMWEQKQVEAAVLVDKLSTTSVAVAQQVGLIASRLGLWASEFTNPELADLLEQTDEMLTKADVSKQRKEELLAPVYGRIELNYLFAAKQVAINAFQQASTLLLPSNPSDEVRAELQRKSKEATDNWAKVTQVSLKQFLQDKSLAPIVAVVSQSGLPNQEALLAEIAAIDEDLKFFVANHKLRRRIDFTYLYHG